MKKIFNLDDRKFYALAAIITVILIFLVKFIIGLYTSVPMSI